MGALDSENWERHAAGKTYAPATPAAPSPTIEKYEVQRGDTLSKIAKDAGISLQELKDLNPKFTSDPKYKNGNMIWAGTKVNLPGQASAPTEEIIPVVKVPEEIRGPFSGNPGIIFTPIVTAVPINLPPPPPPPPTTYKVKIANPEVILFDDETLPATTLIDILFEDIGGQELLSMSRHDIISGDYVPNQLIKNLTSLNQEFSSKRLLSLQNTSDKYFSNFGIKLENKIPFVGGGVNGENVYLNDNQDIVIDLINLDIDEQVEVQLSISGTIYTIVLEAGES